MRKEQKPGLRWQDDSFGDHPIIGINWFAAAEYCNWLSEKEGLRPCYVPNAMGKYEEGMKLAPDYLRQTGYRLPTEAEWEYACLAGAQTRFAFGNAPELLDQYAWQSRNSVGKPHRVGTRKPNDRGLYDMHGNASEWTLTVFPGTTRDGTVREDAEDKDDIQLIVNSRQRVLRGGSFRSQPSEMSVHERQGYSPSYIYSAIGFRPARSMVVD
jgi:formylglycine-generating enzyme required for sulfatase activity